MSTTPKKAFNNFRPPPYKTPMRASPAGHMKIVSPSSPLTKVGGRQTYSTPPRPNQLPVYLQPEPTLAALLEETTHVFTSASITLTNEDATFLMEFGRLERELERELGRFEAPPTPKTTRKRLSEAAQREAQRVDVKKQHESPRPGATDRREKSKKQRAKREEREQRATAPTEYPSQMHERTPPPPMHFPITPPQTPEGSQYPSLSEGTPSLTQEDTVLAARILAEAEAEEARLAADRRQAEIEQALLEKEVREARALATKEAEAKHFRHNEALREQVAEAERQRILAEELRFAEDLAGSQAAKAQRRAEAQAETWLRQAAEEAHMRARREEEAHLMEQALLEKEAREARALAAKEAEAAHLRHIQGLSEKAVRQRKLAEEKRVAEDIARSQEAQRRAEAQAEATRRQAVEEARLRARREEARLRALREEEVRLHAERKAELLARQCKAEQERIRFVLQAAEASMQAQRLTFETLAAQLHMKTTYTDAFIAVLELQCIHEVYAANVQAFREEMARLNFVHNQLAEFYRQQDAQLAQEEGFLQYAHQQQQFHPPPEQGASGARGTFEGDVPMRDASFMDFSMHSASDTADDADMHSAADDMAYADSTPPPQTTPPPPPPPPTPLTDEEFFDTWDRAWVEIRDMSTLTHAHFSQLPWPVLDECGPAPGACVVQGPGDITAHRVQAFIKKYHEHRGLTGVMKRRQKIHEWLVSFHSDQSNCRVVQKMWPDHQEVTRQILQQCTILLIEAKKSASNHS